MKRLFIFIFPLLLYSCGSNNIDSFFSEKLDFPYVVDSSFIASLSTNENYKPLEGKYLKMLYRDVKKAENWLEDTYVDAIIESGSSKESGQPEENNNEYQGAGFKALHKIALNNKTIAYSWYIYEPIDNNQGVENVFVTIFKENKPYSCFLLGQYSSYSDSPMWSDLLQTAEIKEDGNIIINKTNREGEYIEDELVISESSHILNEVSINDGDFEVLKTETVSSYTKEDEKEANIGKVALSEIVNLFAEKKLPINIDSTLVSEINSSNYKALEANAAYTLGYPNEGIGRMYPSGSIDAFIEIDSLKQIDQYDKYLEKVEAGMTVDAEAFALIWFNLDENIKVFIWAISDRTPDMCPHNEGTVVLASFAKENTVLRCYPVAEISGGGDPPMWGSIQVDCKITKSGEFNISALYEEGDDDAGTVDKSKESFNFIWKDGKFEKIAE